MKTGIVVLIHTLSELILTVNLNTMTGWTWIYVLSIATILSSCAAQPVPHESVSETEQRIPITGIELEEGKCYAKCYIPDQMGVFQKFFPIYQGDPSVVDLYEEQEVLIRPGQELWEKRQADPTCKSSNPEDCLVWCLVEIPPIYKSLLIADRSKTNEFRLTPIEFKEVIAKGGYTEMKVVVCAAELSKEYYTRVQEALITNGYDLGPSGADGIFGSESISALTKYQKDRGLPVGHFNEETISSLGLAMPKGESRMNE